MAWTGLGAVLVEIEARTYRVTCPIHGVVTAYTQWAYPGSGFTRDFDLTVGSLAVYLPRSVVSEYMRVDWETVGRCINRTRGFQDGGMACGPVDENIIAAVKVTDGSRSF
ncbi:helix-turn-helix domain-containing protein [Butyrivibrio fibrisolvens]|uniref:Transposase IS204/IS1001/IS1096/IS1165 helix-turn-helix domain-containing protein n=1 Tax=Butyrivibrio fibrisolvens TaxID=831 RepID=A0A317G5T1_BUTFI|nr:hypothetical protein CPT75_17360 [Butyrivibrio fibrisolvens]